MWAEITTREYIFDRDERSAEMLKRITRGEIQSFVHNLFVRNVRKLSIQVTNSREIRESGYSKLDFLQSPSYTLIWRSPTVDDNSVSLWQPVLPNKEYYLLGDVMVQGGDEPSTSALVFKPLNPDDVSEPLRAEAIWNSAGDKDLVTVFRLYPASGYRCIGAVAVRGTQPDLSKYRCVRSGFLKRAATPAVWDAKDTSLRYRQFYFFSLTPKNQGLPMNHFYISSAASVSAKFVVNSEFIQPFIPKRYAGFG
eukprot:sb/3468709/